MFYKNRSIFFNLIEKAIDFQSITNRLHNRNRNRFLA
jgi:hypothetical protein